MAEKTNIFDPNFQKALIGSEINPATKKAWTEKEVLAHFAGLKKASVNAIAVLNKKFGVRYER